MRRQHEQGFALMVVLWVMVLITVIALELSLTSRQEVQVTGSYLKHVKVSFAARSTLESMVEHILANYYNPGFTDFGADEVKVYFEKLNDSYSVIKVVDEDHKVNLGSQPAAVLINVFSRIGVENKKTLEIVDCIDDWIDPDELHRLNGAEDDYYESLPIPYEAKDAPLLTAFELLLVKGITKDIFYGAKRDDFSIINLDILKEDGKKYRVVELKDVDLTAGKRPEKNGLIEHVRVSERLNIVKATKSDLQGFGFNEKDIEKILPRLKKVRSVNELIKAIGNKKYDEIKDEIEIVNKNIFNITIETTSDDGSVKKRIYAKVKFDDSSANKYRYLEYKEGF